MIVVLKVETIEVPGDVYEYGDFGKPKIHAYRPGNVPEERSYKREFIQGRRFIDENGRELIMGMTKQAHSRLEVPFNVISNLQESLATHRQDKVIRDASINRYQSCISKLGRTGFWKRLKFLFTGIIIEVEP